MPAHGPREHNSHPTAAHPAIGQRMDVGPLAAAPHPIRPERWARAVLATCLVSGAGTAAIELFAPAAYGSVASGVALWLATVATAGIALSLVFVARASRLQGGLPRRAAGWRLLAIGFLALALAPVVLRGAVAEEAAAWIAALWPSSRAELIALAGRPWFAILGPLATIALLAAVTFAWTRAAASGLRDTVFLSGACLVAGLGLYALPAIPGATAWAASLLGWSSDAVRGAAAAVYPLLLLFGAGAGWCVALRHLAFVGDGLRLRALRGVVAAQPYAANEGTAEGRGGLAERAAGAPAEPRGPGVTLRGTMLRSIARRTPPPSIPRPTHTASTAAPSKPRKPSRSADRRPELDEPREPAPLPPLRTTPSEVSLPPLRS